MTKKTRLKTRKPAVNRVKTRSKAPLKGFSHPEPSHQNDIFPLQRKAGNRTLASLLQPNVLQEKPAPLQKMTARDVNRRYKALLRALGITRDVKLTTRNYRYDWRWKWRMHWDKIPFSVENRPHCNNLAEKMKEVYRKYNKAEETLKPQRVSRGPSPTDADLAKEKILRHHGYRIKWELDGKYTIHGQSRIIVRYATYREYKEALADCIREVKSQGIKLFKEQPKKPPWTAAEIIAEGKKRYDKRRNIWHLGDRIKGHPDYIPYVVGLGVDMANRWHSFWMKPAKNKTSIQKRAMREVLKCIDQKRKPFDCVESAFNVAVFSFIRGVIAKTARLAESQISEETRHRVYKSIEDNEKAIMYYPLGPRLRKFMRDRMKRVVGSNQ